MSEIVGLGQAMGIRVIAEGIETEAQRDRVEALGADFAQGHLCARACPSSQATAMLASEPSNQDITPEPTPPTGYQKPTSREKKRRRGSRRSPSVVPGG